MIYKYIPYKKKQEETLFPHFITPLNVQKLKLEIIQNLSVFGKGCFYDLWKKYCFWPWCHVICHGTQSNFWIWFLGKNESLTLYLSIFEIKKKGLWVARFWNNSLSIMETEIFGKFTRKHPWLNAVSVKLQTKSL